MKDAGSCHADGPKPAHHRPSAGNPAAPDFAFRVTDLAARRLGRHAKGERRHRAVCCWPCAMPVGAPTLT